MTIVRIFICVTVIWLTIYVHIDANNELTELRRLIPELEKEVKALVEDNIRLQFDIDRFKDPLHLMELAKKPEYSFLKYPYTDDVIIISD